MKLATFFISSTRRIFTKLLALFESLIKIKVKSDLTLFGVLLTSAAICKQKLFHGNELAHYLENCKLYNVGQNHFQKSI